MKAICLSDATPETPLVEAELPKPRPAGAEVLVRVHAAGVTPTELSWYPTTHTREGGKRRNAVPGHEFSGVVAAMGPDASGFEIGQAVYGMNDWFSAGATAEFCLTIAESIAPKPSRLSHVEAASVPISALTAWQGLFDRARLRAGERVLVHGGAGAVGIYAIQLARHTGAQVLATASGHHADFLRQLGATVVIDYHTSRFEEQAGEVDVVFDTVGGATLERSWNLLKGSGRMVTIAASDEGSKDERTKAAFFIVEPKQRQLIEIAGLLESGALVPCVDGIVPLAQAAAAYLGTAKRALGRGKLVVSVNE